MIKKIFILIFGFLFIIELLSLTWASYFPQENANQTSIFGNWKNTGAATYDGNWTTKDSVSAPFGGDAIAYLIEGYSIPSNAQQASSIWQVKDEIGTENWTIPSICWNYGIANGNTLQVKAESVCSSAVFFICSSFSARWYCFSGDWTLLRNTSGGNQLFEDAMMWNISAISSCEYNSGDWVINFNDNCTLSTSRDISPNNLVLTGSSGYVNVSANISFKSLFILPDSLNQQHMLIVNKGARFM